MLPEKLSNYLCSLRPDSNSIVITIEVERAVISLHAFIRHQNQRRIRTKPIPAPIEKINAHALEILCIFKAVKAARIIRTTTNKNKTYFGAFEVI